MPTRHLLALAWWRSDTVRSRFAPGSLSMSEPIRGSPVDCPTGIRRGVVKETDRPIAEPVRWSVAREPAREAGDAVALEVSRFMVKVYNINRPVSSRQAI